MREKGKRRKRKEIVASGYKGLRRVWERGELRRNKFNSIQLRERMKEKGREEERNEDIARSKKGRKKRRKKKKKKEERKKE